MKNKNLILTIMTGFDPCYKYAINSFKHYASKTNSDFKIITKSEIDFSFISTFDFSRAAWAQKFLISKYLNDYDQILYIDADIIINKNASNIFKIYNDLTMVYMFNEAPFENRLKEFEIIEQLAKCEIDKTKYFNAGVILVGNKSNFLSYYSLPDIHYFYLHSKYYEQTYFNYLDKIGKIKICEIDSRFNRMAIIKPVSDRFNADFIHHAGSAYSTKSKFRFYQFIQDFCTIYGYKLKTSDYINIIIKFILFYSRRKVGKLLK